jgi:hypothetical protein
MEVGLHRAQIGRDARLVIDAAASTFSTPLTKMYEVEPGVFKNADDLIE